MSSNKARNKSENETSAAAASTVDDDAVGKEDRPKKPNTLRMLYDSNNKLSECGDRSTTPSTNYEDSEALERGGFYGLSRCRAKRDEKDKRVHFETRLASQIIYDSDTWGNEVSLDVFDESYASSSCDPRLKTRVISRKSRKKWVVMVLI